jgi:hypothetical protein
MFLCSYHDYLFLSLEECISTIDGTHVTVGVPKYNQQHTEEESAKLARMCLVFVDFDLKFTYVLALEGSCHHASITTNNMSRPDGVHLSDGTST